MYYLVFLLCIKAATLDNMSCEIMQVLTTKDHIQINKEQLTRYAVNNGKTISMFTIKEY